MKSVIVENKSTPLKNLFPTKLFYNEFHLYASRQTETSAKKKYIHSPEPLLYASSPYSNTCNPHKKIAHLQ